MSHRPSLSKQVMIAGLVLSGFSLTTHGRAAQPAPPTPATQPAAAVTDPAVRELIDQLGHPDADTREQASNKLRSMGKAALPALQQAADSDDPEVKARVRALVRHAGRRLPPAAPQNGGEWGRGHAVSISVAPGRKVTDVEENGRKIQITQRDDGSIDMTVSGVDEAGKEASETYQAKDAAELKRDHPEAHALYERWVGPDSGWRMIRGIVDAAGGPGAADVAPERLLDELRRQMLRDVERVGPERLGPAREHLDGLLEQLRGMDRVADRMIEQQRKEVDRLVRPGALDIDKLREQLLRPRDEEGKLLEPEGNGAKEGAPKDGGKRDPKARAFDDFGPMREALRRALEQDREQIAKLSNELRRQLEDMRDLGLVRPERVLAARPMLGVAVALEEVDGEKAVTVMRVVPGSRAAKIGIEEGDVLRRVNGKDVKSVPGLLERVAELLGGEKPERVVVELEREGKALKLEEK
jgi:PDZ domain